MNHYDRQEDSAEEHPQGDTYSYHNEDSVRENLVCAEEAVQGPLLGRGMTGGWKEMGRQLKGTKECDSICK